MIYAASIACGVFGGFITSNSVATYEMKDDFKSLENAVQRFGPTFGKIYDIVGGFGATIVR